jgi:hypothetical protein
MLQTQVVSGPVRTVAVTAPDYTQVSTADVTTLEVITRSSFIQLPNPTSTLYVTVTAAAPVKKREDLPAELQTFAPSRLSSACSCIATPVTRTVLATQISSVSGADDTQTVPGATVTSVVFRTVVVTTETNVIQTLSPTGVAIQTIATTVAPVPTGPFCGKPGAPKIASYQLTRLATDADCVASCKADARCLSVSTQRVYVVQDDGSLVLMAFCRSFDKSVAESANLSSGGYLFYEKSC